MLPECAPRPAVRRFPGSVPRGRLVARRFPGSALAVGLRVGVSGGVRPAVAPGRWVGGPSAAPRVRTEGGPAVRRFPGSALAVGLRVGVSGSASRGCARTVGRWSVGGSKGPHRGWACGPALPGVRPRGWPAGRRLGECASRGCARTVGRWSVGGSKGPHRGWACGPASPGLGASRGLRPGVSGGVRPVVSSGRWGGGVGHGDPAAGAVGAAHRRVDGPAPPGLRSSRLARGSAFPGPAPPGFARGVGRRSVGGSTGPHRSRACGPEPPGSAPRGRPAARGTQASPSTSARRSNAAPRRSLGSAPLPAVLPREYV